MLKRNPPQIRDGYGLDALIESSKKPNKAVLKEIKDTLVTRYDEYVANRYELEKVQQIERSSDIRKALYSKYNTLRRKEGTPPSLRCPLCQISHARQWDHYLPRDAYPDFSAFDLNLIWICPTCNGKKGANNISPKRKVLNAYFDPIAENINLVCNWHLTFGGISVSYSLKAKECAEKYIVDIATEHFDLLGLSKNFVSEATIHIQPFCLEIEEELISYPNIEACVAAIINRKLASCRRYRHEENHWERVLWEGAEHHIDCIVQYIGEKLAI